MAAMRNANERSKQQKRSKSQITTTTRCFPDVYLKWLEKGDLSFTVLEGSLGRFSILEKAKRRREDDSTTGGGEAPRFTSVIRYDNNCATIPFLGSPKKTMYLKNRMESNTHKHHIYLLNSFRETVPPWGPYQSLHEVYAVLKKSS